MKDGHESCHIFMSVFQFPSFCFQTGLPKSMKEATAMKNTEAFFSDVRDPGSWEALESTHPQLFWPRSYVNFLCTVYGFDRHTHVATWWTERVHDLADAVLSFLIGWSILCRHTKEWFLVKKERVKLTTSIYIYKAHRHYKQKLLSVILLFISCCKKQINVSTLPTFLVRQELLKIQNLICWHPKHQNIWILDLTSLGQKTQSAQNFTRQQWNI